MSENNKIVVENKEATSGRISSQGGLAQVPHVTPDSSNTDRASAALSRIVQPFANNLCQGDLISGSKERRDRRWIAVILHEEEIRDACESTGIDFDTLDLDNVVKWYTDALVGDGGWYESLKAIVREEAA